MNTGMLTLQSAFLLVGAGGPSPVPSGPSQTSNTNHPVLTPADDLSSTNPLEAPTTDNKVTVAQTGPVPEQPQKFGPVLRQTTVPNKTQNAHGQIKPKPDDRTVNEQPQKFDRVLCQTTVPNKTQNAQGQIGPKPDELTSEAVGTTNNTQLALAQHPVAGLAVPGKGTAAKTDNLCRQQPVLETANKPAKSISPPQAHKAAPLSAQLLNSASAKPCQSKPLTQGSEESSLPIINQHQPPTNTISPGTSKHQLTADNQSNQGGNPPKIPTSGKTFVTAECIADQQSPKELVTQAPGTISETIAAGDKTFEVIACKTPVHELEGSQAHQKTLVGEGESTLDLEKPADNQTNMDQQTGEAAVHGAAKQGHSQIHPELSPGNGKNQSDNTSGDSSPKELNVAQVQTSTQQAQDNGSQTIRSDTNPDFEQVPAHNDAQTYVVERSFASSHVAKSANDTSTADASASTAAQIQEHIHSTLQQGEREITIRLYPPELGKVFVRLQEHEGQITGLLEVSKTQTRYDIEQVLPQIIRNLQDSGVQIKRLEVTLTDQSDQQAYKDQSLQDGSFQPHNFAEAKHPHNAAADAWPANDDGYRDISEPQVQITDSSINMLM